MLYYGEGAKTGKTVDFAKKAKKSYFTKPYIRMCKKSPYSAEIAEFRL